MKIAAYFSGTFFTSLTVLAMLFKIMHWPGAGMLAVLALTGIALIAVPLIGIYKYHQKI